ncbi:hypothetical protein [Halorubellus litoreus]|uniref:Uncharacterized protein n=1 Tax=Halorubellus litoreus TaxID=755308 RepID=A0ABD5VEF6_9EURY
MIDDTKQHKILFRTSHARDHHNHSAARGAQHRASAPEQGNCRCGTVAAAVAASGTVAVAVGVQLSPIDAASGNRPGELALATTTKFT